MTGTQDPNGQQQDDAQGNAFGTEAGEPTVESGRRPTALPGDQDDVAGHVRSFSVDGTADDVSDADDVAGHVRKMNAVGSEDRDAPSVARAAIGEPDDDTEGHVARY